MGGMMLPITQNNKAPDSVPRKKSKEGSEGGVKMNLQEELKALKERIAELEEQAKREQEFPQEGSKYWYIDDESGVLHTTYDNHYVDRYHQTTGNIFKTEQEADFAVEKLKVEAELRNFSRKFVWGEENWILYMSAYKNIFLGYENDEVSQGVIYFGSEDKALEAIETVGAERIKKYLFGVEG